MRYLVLGPLEVHDGDAPVMLGGGRQRKLLAVLLVHANEAVAADRLIDELWDARPPETAAKALQGYVSQLRRRLGPDAVETAPGGYRLRVSPDDVDASRFETLLSEARTLDLAPAALRLRQALALWRGPPFAEFAYDDFARGEIDRLEGLRESCLERRIDLELALGHHDDLVPELEALVREHPLRERLRRHLILALYRSGRQADALEAYRDARTALRDELGLDPGDELQALQRAILAHDSSLSPPARVELPDDRAAVATAGGDAAGSPRPRVPRRAFVSAVGGVALLAAAASVAGVLTLRGGSRTREVAVPFDSVVRVDGNGHGIEGFAPVGRRPVAIAAGVHGVWVANADDGTVDRLDPATGRVVAAIGIGTDVGGLATGFGSVWVADGNDGTITRIDPGVNQVERTISPSGPPTLATSPIFFVATDARYVWATQGERLLRIDPRTNDVRKSLPIGAATTLATGGGFVWVTTTGERLYRIDPRTVRATTVRALPGPAVSSAYGGGGLWLVVATARSGIVEQVDPATLSVSPVAVALRFPQEVAVGGGKLWVTDDAGTLVAVDPRTGATRETLRVGRQVTSLTVTPRRLWLTVARSI